MFVKRWLTGPMKQRIGWNLLCCSHKPAMQHTPSAWKICRFNFFADSPWYAWLAGALRGWNIAGAPASNSTVQIQSHRETFFHWKYAQEARGSVEDLTRTGTGHRENCICWLTVSPLQELGFTLNKREFCDTIKLCYDWPIDDLPSNCVCRE